VNMTDFEALMRQNSHVSVTVGHQGAGVYPRRKICIVTCLDPRTDPANFCQLEVGDAIVIRNAGRRITSAAIDDISFMTYLAETAITSAGPLFEVAVIHHNKCGTRLLSAQAFREDLASSSGVDASALEAEAVVGPGQTVRQDVASCGRARQFRPESRFQDTYMTSTPGVTTVVPASHMLSAGVK
jgi:carbonic anhydrase